MQPQSRRSGRRLLPAWFSLLLLLLLALGVSALRPRGGHRESRLERLESVLSDYDILSVSNIQQHSVRRRDLQPESHIEKLISFSALHRHFQLYLTSTADHFSKNFQALVLDGQGNERQYHVQWQEFFTGHIVGHSNSKVIAHIGDGDFTVRINTDAEEYNVEPLWRFLNNTEDERLLVYRSEDIKDISRLESPKVCGYVKPEEEGLWGGGLKDNHVNKGEDVVGGAACQAPRGLTFGGGGTERITPPPQHAETQPARTAAAASWEGRSNLPPPSRFSMPQPPDALPPDWEAGRSQQRRSNLPPPDQPETPEKTPRLQGVPLASWEAGRHRHWRAA